MIAISAEINLLSIPADGSQTACFGGCADIECFFSVLRYVQLKFEHGSIGQWRMGFDRRVFTRSITELTIFSAVVNLLLLVMPVYLLQVYDRVLPSSSTETLLYLSLFAVGSLIVLGALEIVRSIYASRIAARLDKELGAESLLAAMNGPRSKMGDVSPLRDLSLLRTFISSRALFFMFDLPFAPLFVVVLYFIHPVLFLITLAGAALMLVLAFVNQISTAASSIGANAAINANMNLAQAYTRDFETIRALGMMSNVVERWGEQFSGASLESTKSAYKNAVFSGVSRAFRILIQIGVLGAGAYLVLTGEMTAGMIFASTIISGRALQPLDQIVGSWRQIADARRAYKRLSRELQPYFEQTVEPTALPKAEGKLAVENLVYFAPGSETGEPPLIKRISFTVEAGQSLAIIGPSRAGKSTLLRLIVGAIRPHSGCVRLDGADITQHDPDMLGQHFGYLSQDIKLFPGTVGQNISRFAPDSADENIVAAAKRAHVHDLILTQSDGYETEVDAAGGNLSGGERQRIGLARALYGDPCLLVLDEPNAHLDIDGEKALDAVISEARSSGLTMIIVTHRAQTAAKCDRVLQLRQGAIEKFGPPDQLLTNNAAAQPAKPGARSPLATVGKKPASASFSRVIRAKAR